MKRHFDSISKQEIAEAVAASLDISQALALSAVDRFIEEIKRQYRAGNRVEIRGFGTFVPVRRKARTYRIMRLGSELKTTREHTTLKFKPSKHLTVF